MKEGALLCERSSSPQETKKGERSGTSGSSASDARSSAASTSASTRSTTTRGPEGPWCACPTDAPACPAAASGVRDAACPISTG